MQTFIVLLRGINVGANRKLPMSDLRQACVELGFERPETYIQSGNLIVDADANADDVAARLRKALGQRCGFSPDIVVRKAAAWTGYVAANPFPDGADKMVHLYLGAGPIRREAPADLAKKAGSGERITLSGDALWIDYGPSGVARSKLSPAVIDKACGTSATGRNWTTVQKLEAMIQAHCHAGT